MAVVECRNIREDKRRASTSSIAALQSIRHQGLKCAQRTRWKLGTWILLALLQAGSYVQQHKISFFDFLNIYEAMRKRVDLKPIMNGNKACGVVHDEQRSIWTTWKITLSTLTIDACRTLYATAF